MQKLLRGVQKFQQEVVRNKREFFERLGEGQSPHTLFITCSDSRINPNLLTQTEPGEIFILRNAGNIVPAYGSGGGEAATIEFAVRGLGVEHIVVCGHTGCGAMKALLDPSMVADLPAMRAWLERAEVTRRIVQDNYENRDRDELVNLAIQENVLAQLECLRTHPVVAARLADGTLQLHGWVYKIVTGQVFAYAPAERQFLPLGVDTAPAMSAPRRSLADLGAAAS